MNLRGSAVHAQRTRKLKKIYRFKLRVNQKTRKDQILKRSIRNLKSNR